MSRVSKETKSGTGSHAYLSDADIPFLIGDLAMGFVPLKHGGELQITRALSQRVPDLIRRGEVASRAIAQWAAVRPVFGERTAREYHAIFTAAEEEMAKNLATVPPAHMPFETRLAWTVQNPPGREDEATARRIASTDHVRRTLLPLYDKHNISIYDQIRLIHRAHMKGNEHVLLSPGQAKRLVGNEYFRTDRLGGVVRSPQQLPINISLAGNLALCTSFVNAQALLRELSYAAETLFPKGEINPRITEDTIHVYLSAFQANFALNHPFYEANGRTSEDLMYMLWQRRPDLAHTVRYPSPDGKREGAAVSKRGTLIDFFALSRVRAIGQTLGLTENEVTKIFSFTDFKKKLGNAGKHMREMEAKYLRYYDLLTLADVVLFSQPDAIETKPIFNKLAENLKNSSPTYTLADGTTLPR